MSDYRVCVIKIENHDLVNFISFDNKEDAEHHAKNQSVTDKKHIFEVQKNNKGEFDRIKAYLDGQEV